MAARPKMEESQLVHVLIPHSLIRKINSISKEYGHGGKSATIRWMLTKYAEVLAKEGK